MTQESNIEAVPQLTDALTALTNATGSLATATSALREQMRPYDAVQLRILRQIADLRSELEECHNAYGEDPNVVQCQVTLDEALLVHAGAKDTASTSAITAWEAGLSDGRKQWQQDGYGIALRTTRTPVVMDASTFLEHVERIHATTIIQDVIVKLRKKEAMALHNTIPLDGLTVTTSTSCTLKRL